MLKAISADLVVTNHDTPIKEGIVIIDTDTGIIEDVLGAGDDISLDIERHRGLLVPGYINAHCHLELSHLKDVIDTGTGLIPFIKGVVTLRQFDDEIIQKAIVSADEAMYDDGIVAIGDISNTTDTVLTKSQSSIRYHTFVEMFDFLQDQNAQSTFDQYYAVYKAQPDVGHHKKSMVPHAPYSVSKTLFGLINQANQPGVTLSIHNQELLAENQLFIDKTGLFIDFYRDFHISLDAFNPSGQSSIYYMMSHLNAGFKTLMVHNTQTTRQEIADCHKWNPETYWVTCPNANLYIENRLPNYEVFVESEAKVCIGTDSLSSNWQLSIFEEMKTIKKYQSRVDDLDIIRWATLNGAEALGYKDLGMILKGLAPGINLIDVDVHEQSFDLSQSISSTKII
jgi:Cytosine deaminase and related metal-dependent hydrolases